MILQEQLEKARRTAEALGEILRLYPDAQADASGDIIVPSLRLQNAEETVVWQRRDETCVTFRRVIAGRAIETPSVRAEDLLDYLRMNHADVVDGALRAVLAERR